MSAIGQPILMQIYNEVFSDFGINTAQCLMTHRDFENSTSQKNTLATINELLQHDYIPIINENDTIATEEIIFGDNDKLSALVATLIDADILILATDTDGLFDKNPHTNNDAKLINEVTSLDKVEKFVEDSGSKLGTGGMKTKLQAAKICKQKNIEMWIVNAKNNNFLINALAGKIVFTKFKL